MASSAAAGGSELVLVFDMDGTLFDTEEVKLASFRDAFRPLCGEDQQALAAIDAYNASHRGVPRSAKFDRVLTLLGASQSEAGQVAMRYAALLAERLPLCRPIRGVVEFLQAVPATRFVASSAPREEIVGNLTRHRIASAFADVYAHPWSKEQALEEVARRHRAAQRVFFGDAPADLAAATSTKTRFVAINPNRQLAAHAVPWFSDFHDVDAITACLAGQAE